MKLLFRHRLILSASIAFILCSCSAVRPKLENKLTYNDDGKVTLLCVYSGPFEMPARKTIINNMTNFANALCSNNLAIHSKKVTQQEEMLGAKKTTAQIEFSCTEGEPSKFGSPEHLLCSSMFIDTDAPIQKDTK